MTKDVLKGLRIFYPGVFIFGLIAPLVIINFDIKISFLANNWGFITALGIPAASVLGGIYYSLNIRKIYHERFLDFIDGNIKNRLLSNFLDDEEISKHALLLLEGDKLMHVFYTLVDNNESLKSKRLDVYLNGFVWSLSVDFAIFGKAGVPLYLISFLFLENPIYVYIALACESIFFVTHFLILSVIQNNHLKRSNNQIDYIHASLSDRLREEILGVI